MNIAPSLQNVPFLFLFVSCTKSKERPASPTYIEAMDYKSLFTLSVLIGLIPAMIAYDKGHRFWKWWIFGAILFFVALPKAILLKPRFQGRDTNQPVAEGMKKCLYCAETIRLEAVTCQFCGRDLVNLPGLVEPTVTRNVSKTLNLEHARMENILKVAILVAIVLLMAAMGLLMWANLKY